MEPVTTSIVGGLLAFALEKIRDKAADVIAEPALEKLKPETTEELWSVLEHAYLTSLDKLGLSRDQYTSLLEPLLEPLRSQKDGMSLVFAAGLRVHAETAIDAWRNLLDEETRARERKANKLLPEFAANVVELLHKAAERSSSSLRPLVVLLHLVEEERKLDLLIQKEDPRSFDYLFRRFQERYLQQEFAGRQTTLQALEDWLSAADSPPYLLLTAEAGRGKSALLVRWTETVKATKILVPVSIWARTNSARVALGSLARWLAVQHGLSPAEVSFGAAEELEREVRSLLERDLPPRKRILVVLDGLDEASGWTPDFPSPPGAGIKVVISARLYGEFSTSDQWRAHLRLSSARYVSLPGLEEDDIRELIHSAGALGEDLTHQLFINTQGDPLLLKLYRDEMGKGGQWTVARLRTIQPGYGGFFEEWWKDQRTLRGGTVTSGMQAVLAVLSLAEGPMFFEEIADLLATAMRMGKAEIDQELRNLDRLLLGGRQTGQPYTFVHDRLRFYFREHLVGQPVARETWYGHFIDWGANVLARLGRGDLKSQEVPEYLILHYAEHLDRIANTPPERYFELLCGEWREAAIRIDNAESTFFSDAERVFEKAKRIGVGVLGHQIRALLCRISISASGDGLSARDLRDLVQSKKAGETWAIDIARRKPTPLERSTYLCALAPLIKGQTTELLTEAVGNALALSDYWESADVLVGVIPALGSEQLPIVLDALARMSEPSRLDPLLALAEQPQFHSHRTVILDAALDCIRSIRWPYFAIDAALRIAEHATDSMRDKAIEKGIDIASEMTRVEACAAYVRLLKVASPAQKAAILKKAKVKARKLESPWRALFNLDILPYLESPHLEVTIAQLKKLAARWNMLDANLRRRLGAIPEVQTSIPSVSLVGPPTGTAVAWPSSFRSRIYNSEPGPRTLAERDSYGRVLGAYSGLASVRVQEEASASILRLTQEFPDIRSELGVLSSSLLSSSISSETLSRFLEELGPNLPARAEMLRSPTLSHRKRMQVIDELLKMVTTNSPSDRSLENLARAICEYPNPAVRKRWTTPLDAPELPSGLARLRTFVAKTDVKWALKEGIGAIRSIPNLELRTERLIGMAGSLPEDVRKKEIRDAVQWVRRINDPRKRALLFCRLSDFVDGDEAKTVIRKARLAYDKIADAAKRKRAARQIVFRVDESELKTYLSEAVPELSDRTKYVPQAGNTASKMTDAQFFLLDFVEYTRGVRPATLYPDIVHAVWRVAYDGRLKNGRPITRGAWLETLAVVAGCMPTTESRRMGHEIRAACSRRKGERAGEILIEMGARFPAAEVLEFCPELLADSAIIKMLDDARRRTRGDLYRLLAALAPVIFKIGGQSAVDQVLQSLVHTASWWPVDGCQRNAL